MIYMAFNIEGIVRGKKSGALVSNKELLMLAYNLQDCPHSVQRMNERSGADVPALIKELKAGRCRAFIQRNGRIRLFDTQNNSYVIKPDDKTGAPVIITYMEAKNSFEWERKKHM